MEILDRPIDHLRAIDDYQSVIRLYHILMEPKFDWKTFIHYFFSKFAKKVWVDVDLLRNFHWNFFHRLVSLHQRITEITKYERSKVMSIFCTKVS